MSSGWTGTFVHRVLAGVLMVSCARCAPEHVRRDDHVGAADEGADSSRSDAAAEVAHERDAAGGAGVQGRDAARPTDAMPQEVEAAHDAGDENSPSIDAGTPDVDEARDGATDARAAARDGGSDARVRADGSSRDAAAKPLATLRNPLNAGGPDPWLLYHDGAYYLAATTWSSEITMRRATTLGGLKSAEEVVVWKGDQPARCCNIWAPEFHLLDGPNGKRWYLYFSAGPAGMNTDNQRNHVLESAGLDPLGPYTYKARVYDARNDLWAIDASVVTIQGKTYFLYSAWEGQDQGVYIAAMSNPWTVSSARVRIARPTHGWETTLARVNEAPVALQRGERTFVIYSASACWGPDYKLGMLTLTGTDPLVASSWAKHPQPVFARADRARAFGPGHNGFFTSPDGTETWIVYHANETAQGACDMKRTTRAQKIDWNEDGTPNFGSPVPADMDIPVPSGE
jgi:GH43 family beta-xylosidase